MKTVISEYQNYIQNRNKKIRDEYKNMDGKTVAKVQALAKKYELHEQSIYLILKGKRP